MAVNGAMIAVFEKLGFREEGRLRAQDRLEDGSFCDHALLGCFPDELVDPAAGEA
jgi:RimJ/RimL family protein N-acetyltransferase